MAGDDKTEKVKRYLAWIAPQEGLESLTGEPRLLEGIDETPWSTAPEVERAAEAVERLDRAEPVTPEQTDALEAIILPKERPVVDVVDGSFAAPAAPFAHLDQPDKPGRRSRARSPRSGGSSCPTIRRCPTAAPASSSGRTC